MAKNLLQTGIGFSKEKDSYKAALSASKDAIKQLKGKAPKLSIIFYSGDHRDAKQINKALKEVFSGTEFIGGSTDAVIYKDDLYADAIVVASIYSDYLHFGVSSIDNVSKNPKGLAKQTIKRAVEKIQLDKYIDSYMAFSRVKKGNVTELIRVPSFFVFTLTRGYLPTKMGNEDLIIDGIGEEIGYYVPVFGGSLGANMDNIFNNTPYAINTFHSGKIMQDGLVTAFACTGLMYANSLAHGAQPMNNIGFISGVSGGGFVVKSINNSPILDWYAKQIGVTKKEFTKKLLFYTQKYPLGFPDGYGNIIMRAGGVPHPEGLAYIAPFKENTPVYVMDLENNKSLLQANKELLSDVKNQVRSKESPGLSFVVSCSSRRRVLDPKSSKKELVELNKLSNSANFGFASFGEIGSKPAEACHYHHLCTNVFNIYDRLLSK
jgi:hypothetical protein